MCVPRSGACLRLGGFLCLYLLYIFHDTRIRGLIGGEHRDDSLTHAQLEHQTTHSVSYAGNDFLDIVGMYPYGDCHHRKAEVDLLKVQPCFFQQCGGLSGI